VRTIPASKLFPRTTGRPWLRHARKNLKRFMQEDKIVVRSLKSGAWMAAFTTLLFFYAGHRDWGLGFLIGALVSLFSLFSLFVIVPILFQPGASPQVKGLLTMTLFMKLPLYCIGLSMANPAHGVEPMATGLGTCLVPLVLMCKGVMIVVLESVREQRACEQAAAKVRTLKAVRPAPEARSAPRGQPVHGALHPNTAHPLQEGV
jgi:hypothetical protein